MVRHSNSIHRENGYDKGAYTYYPVVIVGAGEAGICTWWINRYPGVACDIPAVFYSFSFSPNYKWSTFFPSGQEVTKYLHGVCEKYEIMDKIELNTDVSEASWIEEDESWEVTLTHMAAGSGDWSEKDRQLRISQHGEQSVYVKRETVRARVVISAVGALVEPRGWPESIPGRESFEGDIFHSARWNYDVDLAAKDVIAVGTGCSAAQFVPRLTKPPFNAKSVTQLMRSPPWVVPRLKPPFGEEKWERYSPTIMSRIPLLQRALRTSIFLFAELEFLRTFLNRPYNIESRKKTESKLLAHMMKTVPEKYHEILTPDYGVGCKRKIFDAAWFPALNDPRIHLTTQPLASIQPKSVTLGPGQTYPSLDASKSKIPREEVKLPADVIVLANGFDVTTWLHPLKVRGKSQKLLHDVWDERGGPQAYMGSAMDGFPNFFIVFGPNTATGHSSVVLAIENMVEHTLKFLKPILKGDVRTCEVKKEAEVAWARDIQTKLKDTVFMAESCTSWYKTESGWNSITYPYQASS